LLWIAQKADSFYFFLNEVNKNILGSVNLLKLRFWVFLNDEWNLIRITLFNVFAFLLPHFFTDLLFVSLRVCFHLLLLFLFNNEPSYLMFWFSLFRIFFPFFFSILCALWGAISQGFLFPSPFYAFFYY